MYKSATRNIFLVLLAMFYAAESYAQKWELKKNEDGIKVYTREYEGSDVKALKATLETVGTPQQLAAILLDVKNQEKWTYSTKLAKVIKKLNDNEIILYTVKDMPWPISDRDAVAHIKVSEQKDGSVFITVKDADDYMAKQEDYVRVPDMDVKWVIKPLSSDRISIDYEAKVDPGGSVPAWVVNSFIAKGPIESFKKLEGLLAEKNRN